MYVYQVLQRFYPPCGGYQDRTFGIYGTASAAESALSRIRQFLGNGWEGVVFHEVSGPGAILGVGHLDGLDCSAHRAPLVRGFGYHGPETSRLTPGMYVLVPWEVEEWEPV